MHFKNASTPQIDKSGSDMLTKVYGVCGLRQRGKRFDLFFIDSRRRDHALNTKYIAAAAAATAIKVETWRRNPPKLKRCYICCEFGHEANPNGGKRCSKRLLCMYCGKYDNHESRDCKYQMVVSMHTCYFCNIDGHYAGDRENCEYYKREMAKLTIKNDLVVVENAAEKLLKNLNENKTEILSTNLLMMKLIAP